MRNICCGEPMLYGLEKNSPFYVRIEFELDHQINREYMEKAVKTACKRYPYLLVKLQKSDNKLVFVENDAPVMLYNDGENFTLEPSENNEYLFRFTANGNKLNAIFMHCLTDGRGIHRFINTVLYYYFEKYNGISPVAEDIWKITDQIVETETLNPYDLIEKSDARTHSAFNLDKAYFIPYKKFENGKQQLYKMSLKVKDLMKYSKSTDGTPNACIAAFLGEAIDRADNVLPNKNIYIAVIVDGRTMLKHPETCNQLINFASLEYSQRTKDIGYELTHTCYRGVLALTSDLDFNKGNLYDLKVNHLKLMNMETFEEKHSQGLKDKKNLKNCLQFTVSYPGSYVYDGIAQHIISCNAINENVINDFSLAISTYNDNFDITICTSFKASKYVKEFVNVLEEHQIPVDNKGCEEIEAIRYTPYI